MTPTNRTSHVATGKTRRNPLISFVAGSMVAVLGAAAVATSGGGAAGAATSRSNATGRFLSGSAGGTSFDTVAGIEGEKASYPSNPGANKNSLNGELLDGALKLPFGGDGLQIPDPTSGAVQLGAVAQYAKANKDGSALGASGAIDSNGGIGVGGSKGVPTGGATIDLSSSSLLDPITSAIASLKLTVGAVSARAAQVAIGDKVKDPSASCTSGHYHRVSNADQAGNYKIAGLGIDLTSPLIAMIGSTLKSAIKSTLSKANIATLLDTLNGSPLGMLVTIDGVPTASHILGSALKLDVGDGAITINLANGKVHINLAKVLAFLGLDLNNLCPNTSLLPYLSKVLAQGLPNTIDAAISTIVFVLIDALGDLTVTIAGQDISSNLLAAAIFTETSTLTTAVTKLLKAVSKSGIGPVVALLDGSLLNLIANVQQESSAVFAQGGLQLNLFPGGSSVSLPTIPALPSLPGVPSANRVKHEAKVLKANIRKAQAAKNKAGSPAPSASTTPTPTGTPTATPTAIDLPNSFRYSRLAPGAARPVAVAAKAGTPVVQLNLALATVGPNSAPRPTPTPTTTTPTGTTPPTDVPTGVPAGSGSHGEGVLLPLVLVLLGLVLAGGGAFAYRNRGRYGA